MHTLASAGDGVGVQSDVAHQVPDRTRHFAQLRHGHAIAGIEVEHDAGGGPHVARTFEAPLRHVHLERGLLGDPGQALARVNDGVGRGARLVRDRAAVQPVRRRGGQLLLEERRFVDAIRPALAGDGPAGDVRHHELGYRHVVVEDLGLGGAHGGVKHLVRVGQPDPLVTLHPSSITRSRVPNVGRPVGTAVLICEAVLLGAGQAAVDCARPRIAQTVGHVFRHSPGAADRLNRLTNRNSQTCSRSLPCLSTPRVSTAESPHAPQGKSLYVPVGTGETKWVSGDVYTIKATAETTNGAFNFLEASVPPGGGPAPHVHNR